MIRLDGVRNLVAVWADMEGAPDLGELYSTYSIL